MNRDSSLVTRDSKQEEISEQPATGDESLRFKTFQPLEVEIGCGKGKFLVARAQIFPEINFLGLDRVAKWMKVGERRGEKRKLENLKFLKAEVREFLETVPDETVSIFHIYFPDPWPKRRHHGRRLIQAEFLNTLRAKLLPGGLIEIATDDEDYYAHIRRVVQAAGPWASMRETVNERLFHPEAKTNYELKFEAVGRNLHYLELKK